MQLIVPKGAVSSYESALIGMLPVGATFREVNSGMQRKTCMAEHISFEPDSGEESSPVQPAKTILHITVKDESRSEMAAQYSFSSEQNKQLDELLKPEYDECRMFCSMDNSKAGK